MFRFYKYNLESQNQEQFFSIDHLANDLKGQTVRGGVAILSAQIFKFALQTISTIFVARLLTPEDYGLLGMVTIITSFAAIFSDLGLSAAIIQKPDINHKQVSNLFWINIGIGFLVAFIIFSLAPVLVWFYSEPRLFLITVALSFNFIFGGLTVQHSALLKRQMRFAVLGRLEILSALAGIVTALLLAYLDFGYWSLIFMQWASLVTNAIGVWVACGWRPGIPSRNSGMKSMVAFGGNLTGFRVVNYFTRNLDNLLIGRYWGAEALGLYAKAYQLLLLPIQQINGPMTSVAIPALSSLQTDPKKYRKFYYKAILSISSLSMPIMAFLFASADKIILLLLGEKWVGAVPLFRLLMPAAFVGTFYFVTGWVYQSLGRTDRQFRIGLFNSAITSIIFLISVRWGAVGVAAAFGISQPILYIPAIIYCYKGTSLRVIDLIKVLSRPMFASLFSALMLIGVQTFLLEKTSTIPIIRLIFDLVLYCIFYVITWMFMPNGKDTMIDIFNVLKGLKSRKKIT